MNEFNVMIFDFTTKEVKPYDIIPYLAKCYQDEIDKPKTFDDFKQFVLNKGRYQWWARCEYEMVVTSFPETKYLKIDVFDQIKMNLRLITNILMKECLSFNN